MRTEPKTARNRGDFGNEDVAALFLAATAPVDGEIAAEACAERDTVIQEVLCEPELGGQAVPVNQGAFPLVKDSCRPLQVAPETAPVFEGGSLANARRPGIFTIVWPPNSVISLSVVPSA